MHGVDLIVGLFVVVFWSTAVCEASTESESVSVALTDTGEALVNPQMGWTMHYHSNVLENYGSKLEASDTLEDFPGLSTVYLRVPWSFLEPEEGRYNWSLFDTPAQRWIARGGQMAIRVTCSENWMRYATPQWVQDAGAKGYDYEFGKGRKQGAPLWDPDFGDPVFLEKLDGFLKALAERYDGNPNVAFVDVGTYGLWGEGHTFMSSQVTPEDSVGIIKTHIDLHLKHFKRTLLCINDDFVGHDLPGYDHPITEYALEKGLTLRDDSILVHPYPKSWYHAEMAERFWRLFPVIVEHQHYGTSKEWGAWGDGSLLLQAVEDYHASYLSIHWWPREFLEANRGIIDAINRRLGYRIQLMEISLPKSVKRSEPFTVKTSWRNAGVAPCYPGGFPAWTLKDDKGGIVSVNVDERFDVRMLETGLPDQAPVQEIESTLNVGRILHDGERRFSPAFKTGLFDVYVSVGLRDGTPQIALPLSNSDGAKRYKVGQIEIME